MVALALTLCLRDCFGSRSMQHIFNFRIGFSPARAEKRRQCHECWGAAAEMRVPNCHKIKNGWITHRQKKRERKIKNFKLFVTINTKKNLSNKIAKSAKQSTHTAFHWWINTKNEKMFIHCIMCNYTILSISWYAPAREWDIESNAREHFDFLLT